jgi:hypothetical protein
MSTVLNRPKATHGEGPADPAVLADEIVGAARSRAGLLLLLDYEATLGPPPPEGHGLEVPLLVRGALVALTTAPDARVVVISREEAGHLDARLKMPGVVYAGAGANVVLMMEQSMREGCGQPVVVFIGGGDTVAPRGKPGFAVHVGRPCGEPAAGHWVLDQASAVDLLARLAFSWSMSAPAH